MNVWYGVNNYNNLSSFPLTLKIIRKLPLKKKKTIGWMHLILESFQTKHSYSITFTRNFSVFLPQITRWKSSLRYLPENKYRESTSKLEQTTLYTRPINHYTTTSYTAVEHCSNIYELLCSASLLQTVVNLVLIDISLSLLHLLLEIYYVRIYRVGELLW